MAATAGMTTAAAMTLKSAAVFTACIMTGVAYVALTVPGLVCVEVAERLFAASGHRSVVTIMRVVAVVYVAVEAARAMEPRAGSDEQSAREPVRSVIAVRRAIIRRIVKVTVWANRGNTDINSNLCWCFRAAGE